MSSQRQKSWPRESARGIDLIKKFYNLYHCYLDFSGDPKAKKDTQMVNMERGVFQRKNGKWLYCMWLVCATYLKLKTRASFGSGTNSKFTGIRVPRQYEKVFLGKKSPKTEATLGRQECKNVTAGPSSAPIPGQSVKRSKRPRVNRRAKENLS